MSCAGYLTIKAAASRIYWNRAAGGGGGVELQAGAANSLGSPLRRSPCCCHLLPLALTIRQITENGQQALTFVLLAARPKLRIGRQQTHMLFGNGAQ
jgi:hypothetical protein